MHLIPPLLLSFFYLLTSAATPLTAMVIDSKNENPYYPLATTKQLDEKLVNYYFPLINTHSATSNTEVSYVNSSSIVLQIDSIIRPQISGTVKDAETGEALIGATILVKKTNTGTVTDIDGSYSLHPAPNSEELLVNAMGYHPQEVTFDPNKQHQIINVSLKNTVDEVDLICFPASINLSANQLPVLHYTHPYQWLRGQLPGLIVSQPGNNPWATPMLRQQGIHSLSQHVAPLWVVDGMPAIDPLLLSSHSIAEFNIARRPLDLVQYGLQAGAGIIEVSTEQSVERKLEVHYQGQVSYERPIDLPKVASAAEYRQDPGGIADLGFSTNWLKEVSRNAWSTSHQLNLGGFKKNAIWRTEGSYQNIQGVGRNSAWQQYVGRAFLQKNAWKNRLQLNLQAAGQRRWGTQDYLATFFFASKYNPTAPIRFDDPPSDPLIQPLYEISSLLLRNYFEIAPSLDYFNPVAIQNSSGLFQQNASRWVQAKSKLQITDYLHWRIGAGYHANDQEWGEENRTYALFRGNALSNLPGAAQRQERQNRQEWLTTSFHFEKPIPKGRWNAEAGYHFQRFTREDRLSSTQGFSTDDFTYQDFEAFLNPQSELIQSNQGETHRLIGFLLKNELLWKGFNWRTVYQYQGSTLLGTNKRWSPQYATDLEVELNSLLNIDNSDQVILHGGYAQTGQIPTDKSYAEGQYNDQLQAYVNDNPNLSAEIRRIGQLGVRWNSQNWFATVDYYGSKTSDPIVNIVRNDLPGPFNEFGVNLNQIAIRNRSWELVAGLRTGNQLQWKSSLSWAFTRSYLIDTGEEGAVGFFNIHGQHSTDLSGTLGFNWPKGAGLLEIDAPLGQLIGLQIDRANSLANGRPVHFNTFNGNGLPNPDQSFGVIGNALPRHTYAWNNQLNWKNWQLDWLIRGELGHDLAHLRRAELDPLVDNESLFLSAQNYLPSEYDLPGVIGISTFSDHYIESGDYLSLDHVSISHTIWLGKHSQLKVYLSGQNLLLLTAYSGNDPSPRFVDLGPEKNGSLPSLLARDGQLAPGIDRRYFYPRAQTFTLGLRLNL